MEKTTEKGNGSFKEKSKTASDNPAEAISAIMENYRKQLETTIEMSMLYYDRFLAESREFWNSGSRFGNHAWQNGGYGSVFLPLWGWGLNTTIYDLYQRTIKQMFDQLSDVYDNNMVLLEGQVERKSRDWDLVADKYRNNAEINLETFRNFSDIVNRTGKDQLYLALKAAKSMREEMQEYINKTMDDNRAFWESVVSTSQEAPENGGKPDQKEREIEKKSNKKEAQTV
jgi:hypothetical protein